MLPGKQYTPDDVARAAWRRKWALLIPFVVIAAGTAGVVQLLPNKYRSETLILVVPQRVPETYVRSTVTTRIEDRLQSISQQILSRTRLERIILDNNLYAAERRTGIMEDVVEKMRKDIRVEVIKGDAFRVIYVGTEPRIVMTVTERLASLFIEENLHDRELLAEGTNQFLETQLEGARVRLEQQEKKLETYRKQYAGELPTQAEANLQVVQNTQLQIQSVLETLNRYRDRKLVVESMIQDLNVPDSPPALSPAATADASGLPVGASVQEQLANAQDSLTKLELRLKPEHPDVVRMKRVVAELQKRAETEALEAPLSPEATPVYTPLQLARRNRLKELQTELESVNRQIAAKQVEEQQLRRQAASYQARIEAVPARETELSQLMRDYTTLQQIYADLLAKNEESKVAANLERRQIGEQFKLLDPARLPEKPFSPNRMQIDLIGAAFGLLFGIGWVALLEYRDSSFRTEEEVMSVLALPVLARIPQMISTIERQQMHRRRIALSAAAAVMVVGAGAVVWKLNLLSDLLR